MERKKLLKVRNDTAKGIRTPQIYLFVAIRILSTCLYTSLFVYRVFSPSTVAVPGLCQWCNHVLSPTVTQLQHIPIDVGSPIVSCSAADPYVVIKSRDGVIMLVTLKTDLFIESPRLIVSRPQLSSQVTCLAYSLSRVCESCLFGCQLMLRCPCNFPRSRRGGSVWLSVCARSSNTIASIDWIFLRLK